MTSQLTIGLIAAAANLSTSYGEHLLDAIHQQYPEISGVRIEAADAKGSPIALGHRWSEGPKTSARRMLFDATGNEIGTVTLESCRPRLTNASDVVTALSRRIYSAAALSEPDPFVAGAVRAPKGQKLIDDALAKDPAIITLAFHVTAPGAALNTIVASSFGRIGKAGDKDDEAVIREAKTLREITNNGKRVAVELPLLDSRGTIIGALSTSFKFEPGTDIGRIEKRAVALRDALARRTPSLKALFRPATASSQVRSLSTCHS